MLRFVTETIRACAGLTDSAKRDIAAQFLVSPAMADVITSWVLSCEVSDENLTDEQRSAVPPDSWLDYVRQATSATNGFPLDGELPPDEEEYPAYDSAAEPWTNPALGPNQGAAYDAELEEPYQHRQVIPRQTITMGNHHPITSQYVPGSKV